jgi:aminopeptidase
MEPASKLAQSHALNWSIIAIPNRVWAKKLFPKLSSDEGIKKLWNIIFEICRINNDDPVSTWHSHNDILSKICLYLNNKQYKELKFRSRDTNLIIGLPENHIWQGGSVSSQKGKIFNPNLPTEEVFTLPDRNKVKGRVKITKPLIIECQMVKGCSLEFAKGNIINASAEVGEKFLHSILEVDEGTRRLGEVALVPNSSPISKTELVFYNILIDENAASHIAIGQAYKGCLKGGNKLSDDEFLAFGGNNSLIHLDMMIGSSDMNVDGITKENQIEPIMRKGEWAFTV